VEAVVGKLIEHRDTVCFGVEIPGVEGKAGMVAFMGARFFCRSSIFRMPKCRKITVNVVFI
jgi:hypothetical protein